MKNICDWNNCNEIGEYKAPVEKDNSRKYRLLCLEHVKEFNKNWNYFSGMNDDQMSKFKFDHKDIKAFSVLGVSVGLKWQKIQEKFKALVKKFHPDINAGNKKYEEKLKLITLAYTQLKNTYKEKIDT